MPDNKIFSSTANGNEHILHNTHSSKIINNNVNGSGFSVLTCHSPTQQFLPQVLVNGVQRPITIMDLGKLLLQASRDGNLPKVRELVNRGAPFTADWLGTSPLHLAAKNNHIDTCRLLLKASICKDVKNKVDRTPLHVATYEGHYRIVELLLANKVEIDPRDMLKMTPLHWAVERQFIKIVQILLAHGADPHAISKFRKTPYSLAQAHNNPEVLKLLLMASHLHETNQKQTQKATDSLISEMKLLSKQKLSGDPNPDSYEQMVEQESNREPIPLDDYDGGSSLSNAIVQLQNAEIVSKPLDVSALRMLQDHGISLQDEQENSILTSALQSGRKLVLSEAGKLGLNDLKMSNLPEQIKQHFSTSTTISRQIKSTINKFHPYTSSSGSLITTSTMSQQGNKIVKILSAEEFKQMCGGDLTTAFRKYPSHEIKKIMCDDGQIKVQELTVDCGVSTDNQITRKIILPTSKNTLEMQKLLLNSAIKVESVKSDNIPQNTTKSIISSDYQTQGHLDSKNKLNSSNSIDIVSQQTTVPSTTQSKTMSCSGSLDILEIEKQLIELRKETEDLRKQLEVTQQQNEEYRVRLERVEKELDSYRDDDIPVEDTISN